MQTPTRGSFFDYRWLHLCPSQPNLAIFRTLYETCLAGVVLPLVALAIGRFPIFPLGRAHKMTDDVDFITDQLPSPEIQNMSHFFPTMGN